MITYDDNDRLTTGEAGRVARVSRVTILRWIEAGYLDSTRTPSGHRRIKYADIRALAEGTVTEKETSS